MPSEMRMEECGLHAHFDAQEATSSGATCTRGEFRHTFEAVRRSVRSRIVYSGQRVTVSETPSAHCSDSQTGQTIHITPSAL